MSPTSLPSPIAILAIAPIALFAAACGDAEEPNPGSAAGVAQDVGVTRVEIPAPTDPHRNVEYVEDESETVADRLLEFSEALQRRRFGDLDAWFAEDFVGHPLADLPLGEELELPAGAFRSVYSVDAAPAVDRTAFLDSLKATLGTWTRVDSVLWKVKTADFERARPVWGRIKLAIRMIGRGPNGEVVSMHGKSYARVTRVRGRYLIDRFALLQWEVDRREQPMFVNVAPAAGLAHSWPRFGTSENNSFHWNGAAAGDVDGDGDWDLFVPSDGRNFLYLAQADGTYEEAAEARGVAQPERGTGAVFFDCDRDGDQDLMVAHVGWRIATGNKFGGERIRLYLNDGKGSFREAEVQGLDDPWVAYTLTVFDADGDGWLDVHVCSYGRVESEHNDSWIEATNGSPNALLRNLGSDGEGTFLGFQDIGESAGVRDTRWSYAAAAVDVDEDGDMDLYVANDYGSNRMWMNAGDGTFVDGADERGLVDQGNGMGVSFGDLSGDGRIDVYVSNMSSTAGNRILGRLDEDLDSEVHAVLKKLAAGNSIFTRSDEGDGFERLPKDRGGVGASWAWTPALADLDLDGDLDVFCTNGFVTGKLAFDT